MKWGADQGMLLRVHEMMVLSAPAQLKRLEPVHNKGLRIALGAFCACAEPRKRKIINTAIHVAENSSHPVNRWFKEKEAYEDCALKPKLSRPFFVRPFFVLQLES
jgi:hypothetical protein